jgi:hypothetical protein
MEQIVGDYSELRQDVYGESRDMLLPEDRERLAIIEQEERADLAAILTPEELREYDLRTSRTASTLRNTLGSFEPTEEEFVAIFEAYRVAEEKLGAGNQSELRRAVLASLKEQLDSDRHTALLQLPRSTVGEVASLRDDYLARAAALRHQRDLPDAERNAQLAALQNEAIAKITSKLGERGLRAYRSFDGVWLQALGPTAARP